MPAPDNESPQFPRFDKKRDNLILATESVFILIGILLGIFGSLVLFRAVERLLGNPHLSFLGWMGCLQITPLVVGFWICFFAGLLLGWWLWHRIFANRFALTKQEAYWLVVGPGFRIPVVTRLALRIAGISKADENEIRGAPKERR
ncbi:MAG: hypothetical protein ACJ78Q_13860 [Chloroflexia bacterium]